MKKRNPLSPVKTKYPGVFSILTTSPLGKPERTFYIQYYREGRRHFEPVGVEGHLYGEKKVRLTEAVANQVRADKIRGKVLPNREQREAERAALAARDARWTIGKLATEYFSNRDRQKAVRTDRTLFKRYLEDEFNDKTPEEIDPLSLDRFRKTLSNRMRTQGEKKPLSPTTVRNAMALLRQIVNHGAERNLTKGFPGSVPVPHVAPTLVDEDLSPAQLSALLTALDAATDQDAADVVRLALYTGARREEILRLRWPDVDLEHGLWMLRDRKAGGDTGFPLSAQAVAVLKKREAARSEESDFVFPGTGKRGYLRHPKAAFKATKAAAKLPPTFRLLHGCRHHYATMLVAEGVDLLTVARLLGHRDAQMVMRKYAHVRNDVLAAAAALSGRLIEQTAARAKAKQEQAEVSNE